MRIQRIAFTHQKPRVATSLAIVLLPLLACFTVQLASVPSFSAPAQGRGATAPMFLNGLANSEENWDDRFAPFGADGAR